MLRFFSHTLSFPAHQHGSYRIGSASLSYLRDDGRALGSDLVFVSWRMAMGEMGGQLSDRRSAGGGGIIQSDINGGKVEEGAAALRRQQHTPGSGV